MPKTENINIRIEPELKNRNNFDETEFVKAVSILSNGETLPTKYCYPFRLVLFFYSYINCLFIFLIIQQVFYCKSICATLCCCICI